jgi:hypothetical protein
MEKARLELNPEEEELKCHSPIPVIEKKKSDDSF